MTARHVAVVGAGASGTIQALHLLREGVERVTLIEREREPGRGTAYGTRRPEHLLNVTARRMSVYPDDPDDFARWYEGRGGTPDDYAPRMTFGDYLTELMAAERGRLAIVIGEARDVVWAKAGEEVVLADGRKITADAAVLALGNFPPAPLPGLSAEALGALYVEDPWFGPSAEGLSERDTILLIGTGLTAVDAALTLDATGFRGRILALSRRGLLPRPHLRREPVSGARSDFPTRGSTLLHDVRRRAGEIGWREAVHEVRQVVQRLWGAAPHDERRRFLRHLRPWWDVHRHRIAPAVAERLDAMGSEGRFSHRAGRLLGAERDGGAAIVTWRLRGMDASERLRVGRIVNCSGPELDIRRAGEPLLDALLASGRIGPDSCRLGVDVDGDSRVRDASGEPSATLSAIGPITRGAFWETIAVADIAKQAQAAAKRIAT
ncbi:MAG TPA: FAD-dependent oxidoreductase [Allosphingosinicella sp.]